MDVNRNWRSRKPMLIAVLALAAATLAGCVVPVERNYAGPVYAEPRPVYVAPRPHVGARWYWHRHNWNGGGWNDDND